MTHRTILLDMDGVLVDFFTAALRVHGMEHLAENWPAGEWDMAKVMGITNGEFQAKINATPRFWATLPDHCWKTDLIQMCGEKCAEMAIVSDHWWARNSECAKQKVDWLQAEFGLNFRNYFLGSPKHLLARPGSILIDDNDGNVSKFKAAGGEAILFPQPWNNNHEYSKCDRVAFVRNALQGL